LTGLHRKHAARLLRGRGAQKQHDTYPQRRIYDHAVLRDRSHIPPNLAEWLQEVADNAAKAPALPKDWRSMRPCRDTLMPTALMQAAC
jgi:hypothetical protein